jgi:hypothetical protein
MFQMLWKQGVLVFLLLDGSPRCGELTRGWTKGSCDKIQ